MLLLASACSNMDFSFTSLNGSLTDYTETDHRNGIVNPVVFSVNSVRAPFAASALSNLILRFAQDDVLQNLDALSFTSASDHAALKRASTAAASACLFCACSACARP